MFRKILLCCWMILGLMACRGQSSQAARLIQQYGDDAAIIIRNYGEDGVRIVQQYGEDGIIAVQRHGDEGVNILRQYGDEGLYIIKRHGDEGITFARQHGDEGVSFLRQHGDEGAAFMRQNSDEIFRVWATGLRIDTESSLIVTQVDEVSGGLSPSQRNQVKGIIHAAVCDALEEMVFEGTAPSLASVEDSLAKHTLNTSLDWAGAPTWAPDVISIALKVWEAAESGAPVDWNRERQKKQFGDACSQIGAAP